MKADADWRRAGDWRSGLATAEVVRERVRERGAPREKARRDSIVSDAARMRVKGKERTLKVEVEAEVEVEVELW